MIEASPGVAQIRQHAEGVLGALGVTRIVVVDDEYSAELPGLEEIVGTLSERPASGLTRLPFLEGVRFQADRDVWVAQLRELWSGLDGAQRRELLDAVGPAEDGRVSPLKGGGEGADDGSTELVEAETGGALSQDGLAARNLEEVLSGLENCAFETLALSEWRERGTRLLRDEDADSTVFLFDRDLSGESGSTNEGFELVRTVLSEGAGYCGLITHTVTAGEEIGAWTKLADEYQLDRDRFVVIAKERLTSDSPDRHYSLLRMLRHVALSGRCADVRSAAWGVFAESMEEAKNSVDRLSVLDFDRIVLTSSRQEGVAESDTLFRVFAILMQREARRRMHEQTELLARLLDARTISSLPRELAEQLGEEPTSPGALQIQRFEIFDFSEDLNAQHRPIELGDIFEVTSTGSRFILLAQPCDLMVRPNGKRSYDWRNGRSVALAQLMIDRDLDDRKPGWGELPFYEEQSGRTAFADFARVHFVRLAVLDLCTFDRDGTASIDISGECPPMGTEGWRKRFGSLQRYFRTVSRRHDLLKEKGLEKNMVCLAFPEASPTLAVSPTLERTTVRYDFRRVRRLKQPWSGALLAELSHFLSRAAFEHPFERRQLQVNKEAADGAFDDGDAD